MWTKVNVHGHKELFVGSFYTPYQEKRLVEELETFLQRTSKKEERHIILRGDINCYDIGWDNNSVRI